MKKTIAASVLCAAALLMGCSSTQQADVSPGAVDGSKSCQPTPTCSPATCSKVSCPSAAKAQKADDAASPGAVSDTKTTKSCCPTTKAATTKQCPTEATKQCPSTKAKE
ncbi:MAG: hypothetical protein ACYSWT_10270, partial [Planctomycetota bacterium]